MQIKITTAPITIETNHSFEIDCGFLGILRQNALTELGSSIIFVRLIPSECEYSF